MRRALPSSTAGPTDADLVAAARGGDAAALGLLLERHRPRLLASAFRRLGYGPDAEDVVQDTCLIAMRHIASVRDPDAVGAWLHTVLRRECHQRRRRRRDELVTDALPDVAREDGDVELRIERLELRDWIWGALHRLPETLRVTAMLRYFGSWDSYDEVAAILGIPIGTVRSRLAEAKLKLADALLASAGLIDDDARRRARERERFWGDAMREIFRRGDSEGFVAHCDRDLLVAWSHGVQSRGREHLAAEIDGDLAAGVRLGAERVMAGDGLAVIEGRFTNPPEAPDHCPPGIALVVFGDEPRASRVNLHLSPRPPRPDEG